MSDPMDARPEGEIIAQLVNQKPDGSGDSYSWIYYDPGIERLVWRRDDGYEAVSPKMQAGEWSGYNINWVSRDEFLRLAGVRSNFP